MKRINRFVKTCLCLGLPAGILVESALVPISPVYAQNQSDITGPIIKPFPGNQSDGTGQIILPPVVQPPATGGTQTTTTGGTQTTVITGGTQTTVTIVETQTTVITGGTQTTTTGGTQTTTTGGTKPPVIPGGTQPPPGNQSDGTGPIIQPPPKNQSDTTGPIIQPPPGNQSDITGPIIKPPPGNQSDGTGPIIKPPDDKEPPVTPGGTGTTTGGGTGTTTGGGTGTTTGGGTGTTTGGGTGTTTGGGTGTTTGGGTGTTTGGGTGTTTGGGTGTTTGGGTGTTTGGGTQTTTTTGGTQTTTTTGGTQTTTATDKTQTTTTTGGTQTTTTGGTQTTATTGGTQTTVTTLGSNRAVVPGPSNRLVRIQAFLNTRIVVVLQTLMGGIRIIGNAGMFSLGNNAVVIRILSFARGVTIVVGAVVPGSSSAFPVMPTGTGGGRLTFRAVATGAWVDPPTSEGYRYVMTNNSLFTKIVNFPTGFAKPFTVSVGGKVVGQFKPGDSVDFSKFPGGGVKEFTVTGITPLTDPDDPTAFPLQLAFNTEKADFTMEAIQNTAAVEYYKNNPPPLEPFKITVLTPEGKVELEPESAAKALTEQTAKLTSPQSGLSESQVEKLSAAVESVKRDLNSMSSNFEGLFPDNAGLNINRLNPTMNSASSLRSSLAILLGELKALPKNRSTEQGVAIANMLQEIDKMTVLLEATSPVLREVSQAVAVAK